MTLVALGVIVFLFRTTILEIYSIIKNEFLPCSEPITYSLGSFDERFDITKEEFLKVINTGENTWEESIDRELFFYKADGSGDLTINLIYDSRQEATEKLKDIGIAVDNSKSSYNELKARYNALQTEYKKDKIEFDSRVALFKSRQEKYENEVNYFNANGGARKEDFNRLNKEKNYLDVELIEINRFQNIINSKVENINALVSVLNELVKSLNMQVSKFNRIGEELGEEFEEGTYKEDSLLRVINIYQFNNKGKLARVLAHEFGHALGLSHLENPTALMYRLNNGVNEKLSDDDIRALKDKCEIK